MIRTGLKRPITVLVFFIGLMLFSIMSVTTISIDIFPRLNLPTIYAIEQYGGMSAQQMEGFFATRMQDQFLYVNGIKNIESKNIQGLSLLPTAIFLTGVPGKVNCGGMLYRPAGFNYVFELNQKINNDPPYTEKNGIFHEQEPYRCFISCSPE